MRSKAEWNAVVVKDATGPILARSFLVRGRDLFIWAGSGSSENEMVAEYRQLGMAIWEHQGQPFICLSRFMATSRRNPGLCSDIELAEKFLEGSAGFLELLRNRKDPRVKARLEQLYEIESIADPTRIG